MPPLNLATGLDKHSWRADLTVYTATYLQFASAINVSGNRHAGADHRDFVTSTGGMCALSHYVVSASICSRVGTTRLRPHKYLRLGIVHNALSS